jgi:putative transposase
LTGPIRGRRLPSGVKLRIVRAIEGAKHAGFSLERACEVILLDPRRLRRWVGRARNAVGSGSTPPGKTAHGGSQGCLFAADSPRRSHRDLSALTEADLTDLPPVARRSPHRLLQAERTEILAAADEEDLAHLRHRKLTHHLSRQDRVFCSESTVLRVLRDAGKVPVYVRRSRPPRPRPEVDASAPNRSWTYDLTTFPTRAGDYHLCPVLDACSRKIVGRSFSPEATSATVQLAWGKALAAEGLLADEGPEMPAAHSDRGTQMTSRSTQAFFYDLGIAQSFSRARTPTDNATCESWMATLKCERLYEADTAELAPYEVEAMIDRFIRYYNHERLHQGIEFVTPVERHEGRHTAITAARAEGMRLAREKRKMQEHGGTGEGQWL